jgi:transcription initiation factor IIE alpha subunit
MQDRVERLYYDKQNRINKYFNEKQESIKFSVAQNNAVQIVSALIQKGVIKDDEEIEEKLERFTKFLYEMR